jgi:hypothetical protein
MKLIEGQTLASLLAARPTPEHEQGRFLSILESVCRTIAFAHALRSYSTSNLACDGRTFGEVRSSTGAGCAAARDGARPAAGRARRIFGTPAMPPEQARGVAHLIGGAADLFAIGAML